MRPYHEHLFGDDRPFAACHAATIAQLPGGRLMAVWFGGTEEKHPDTGIWGAIQTASGWSAPTLVAKHTGEAHWNPVLFCAPDGSLHLWWKVGESPQAWSTWTMVSHDQGAHWSEARELVAGDQAGRGPVKNKPIVLHNGVWLAPASRETPEAWQVFVDRSSDNGQSWVASEPIALDPSIRDAGVIQPTLWESTPGSVHMLMRSTCGWICRSDSHDHGLTWTPVVPTQLPNNNSGIDLVRLADGRLVLAHNPVAGNWAARTPLSLLISADNGASWQAGPVLESEPGEYSYPSIIEVDGGVAVIYTWRRERIACWVGEV